MVNLHRNVHVFVLSCYDVMGVKVGTKWKLHGNIHVFVLSCLNFA